MLHGYETVVSMQRKIRVTPAANEVIEDVGDYRRET
jgi:hypothetical protein